MNKKFTWMIQTILLYVWGTAWGRKWDKGGVHVLNSCTPFKQRRQRTSKLMETWFHKVVSALKTIKSSDMDKKVQNYTNSTENSWQQAKLSGGAEMPEPLTESKTVQRNRFWTRRWVRRSRHLCWGIWIWSQVAGKHIWKVRQCEISVCK